jgi:hypothetical protein
MCWCQSRICITGSVTTRMRLRHPQLRMAVRTVPVPEILLDNHRLLGQNRHLQINLKNIFFDKYILCFNYSFSLDSPFKMSGGIQFCMAHSHLRSCTVVNIRGCGSPAPPTLSGTHTALGCHTGPAHCTAYTIKPYITFLVRVAMRIVFMNLFKGTESRNGSQDVRELFFPFKNLPL